MGTLINPNTFDEAIQIVSGMCGGDGKKSERNYLNIHGLGIKLFDLNDYKLAMETLKGGEISKAMFQITK